jgi:hypothetical protein
MAPEQFGIILKVYFGLPKAAWLKFGRKAGLKYQTLGKVALEGLWQQKKQPSLFLAKKIQTSKLLHPFFDKGFHNSMLISVAFL